METHNYCYVVTMEMYLVREIKQQGHRQEKYIVITF